MEKYMSLLLVTSTAFHAVPLTSLGAQRFLPPHVIVIYWEDLRHFIARLKFFYVISGCIIITFSLLIYVHF